MKAFAVGLVAVVLAGCSNGSSGNPEHVQQFEYDPQLCKTLQPETGSQALYGNLKVSRPVQSPFFEKRYNRAMLEGVLEASGNQTQKFIAATGINVYKVPFTGTKNTCLFQHELPAPPQDLLARWNEEAGGDHGGGYLDGVFMPPQTVKGFGEVIMVREDSSRWTLVHEMMHANFFEQRREDGVADGAKLQQQINDQIDRLQSAYSAYKAAPTPAGLETLVHETDASAHILYQALVSGPLEEIADESLLLEEWSNGRLKYVSDLPVTNAAWYINYSRTRALTSLNKYGEIVGQLRDEVAPTSTEDRARFQPTLDFIASINAQMDTLAAKADQIASRVQHHSINGAARITITQAELAHVEAMSNTPALATFSARTATFFK